MLTTAAAEGPIGNRYLLVVETSGAIAKLEHGGRQAVFDLIYSGIEGRLHPGDTFGIWTFQEDVSAGVFPIQAWDPEQKLELASRAGLYLKQQPYKGKASLDTALARVSALIRNVKDVNIIIVCSAEAKLNEPFPLWEHKSDQAKEGKKPVVLTLAAVEGRIAQRGVTIEGEALALPYPPPQLAVTNSPPPVIAPVTNLQAKVPRAPIIMHGAPKPKPAPVETVAETKPLLQQAPETNAVAVAQTSPTPPDVQSAEDEGVGSAPSTSEGLSALLPDPLPVAARERTEVAPVQALGVISPQRASALSPTALILAGVGLLAVGLTLGTWMLISSRRGPQLSSISQSMNRVRIGQSREA